MTARDWGSHTFSYWHIHIMFYTGFLTTSACRPKFIVSCVKAALYFLCTHAFLQESWRFVWIHYFIQSPLFCLSFSSLFFLSHDSFLYILVTYSDEVTRLMRLVRCAATWYCACNLFSFRSWRHQEGRQRCTQECPELSYNLKCAASKGFSRLATNEEDTIP